MNSLDDIISNDEIYRVHGNANFGGMTARNVVNDGVRKCAVGFHCGSTMLSILRAHGLVLKPRGMSEDVPLSKKGKKYARALYCLDKARLEHTVTGERAADAEVERLRKVVEAITGRSNA